MKSKLCLMIFVPLIALCQQETQLIAIDTTTVTEDTVFVSLPKTELETPIDTLKYDLSYQTKIEISTKWINAVRNLDYADEKNNRILAKQIDKYVFPNDTIDSAYPSLFNPMFVNLDEDANEELIMLYGYWGAPALLVFKQLKKKWYLIYNEPFSMHYNDPALFVVNNYSKNKVFYIRRMLARGSGLYQDDYSFYKIIDGKVYPCLQLINESRLYGWASSIGQDVRMQFYFNMIDDGVWVSYDYKFFTGMVDEDDVPWSSHAEFPVVENTGSIDYQWDNVSKTYLPRFFKQKDDLTAEKLRCFSELGNDSLFIKAFDYEINQTLEKGNPEQKRLLKKYLEIMGNE